MLDSILLQIKFNIHAPVVRIWPVGANPVNGMTPFSG